jgi:ribonuclease P protein component
VKRRYRITRANDFKRVRQNGKTYTHPLVLIQILAEPGEQKRIGIIVGKTVGNAVTRNLVKRRIRAITEEHIQKINSNVDILVVARPPSAKAEFQELHQAILGVFKRAELITD